MNSSYDSIHERRGLVPVAVLAVALWSCAATAAASDVTGAVSFTGQVSFAAPIAGIALDDMVVTPSLSAEATGNGEHCDVLGVTGDAVDSGGAYPSGGTVSAQVTVSRGGPNVPDGDCVMTLRAYGNDGGAVSARGFVTVTVPVADIQSSATVAAGEIVARGSKTIAGADKLCLKWVKKQLKLRAKCNWFLLRFGPDGALKCKDAGEEPLGCDNGDYVPGILALAHGDTDQQVNPGAVTSAIDIDALLDQLNCQKFIGRAATNFTATRTKLVQTKCVAAAVDTQACRDTRTKDAAPKLALIDNCIGDQETDVLTGLLVPDLGDSCATTCVDVNGVIDRRCVKSCLEIELSEASDGIIGDLPECGNGVFQQGEGCDDGNLVNGDCCSDICAPENLGDQSCGVGACEVTVAQCAAGEPVTCTPGTAGTEGPSGDPTCSDTIDNDCDGTTDGADVSCN